MEFDLKKDLETNKMFETNAVNILYSHLIGPHKNQGAVLYGNIGTGKTTAFEYLGTHRLFKIKVKKCQHIVREFEQKGSAAIDFYGRNSKINLCLDDLGRELVSKGIEKRAGFYGNKTNIIEEIISDRYDVWRKDNRIRTYFTGQVTPPIIEKLYGKYILDRVNQMCKFYLLNGESLRQR